MRRNPELIGGGSSELGPPVLEAQQALLLDALREARGAPVSYRELRERGIEFPASVVCELELAGIPIERFQGGAGAQQRVIGVRLRGGRLGPPRPVLEPEPAPKPERASIRVSEPAPAFKPAHEPEAVPGPERARKRGPVRIGAAHSPRWSPVHVHRTSMANGPAARLSTADATIRRIAASLDGRLLAPLALLGAAGLVMVLVLSGLGGAASRSAGAAVGHHRAMPRLVAAAPGETRAAAPGAGPSAPPTTSTTVTTATGASKTDTTAQTEPVSPALASELESEGHTMLESGQYAGAVSILEDAVKATGESTSACPEPLSGSCLTYAYALYDLGRALRLSGHAAAAVSILEERLEVDNQRPTVAAELQLARDNAR